MNGRRLDTHLESEGAEFLVCGQLMIEGIPSYKAYTNTAGYDIIAMHPTGLRVAKIQVKSRWATNHGNGFPLKSADADFVIFVALNRGTRRYGETLEGTKTDPEYYVIPMESALAARSDKGWKKVQLGRIDNLNSYRNNWTLVYDFLTTHESGN